MVDRLGHHGLSCRYCASRLFLHANLNLWLKFLGLGRGDDRHPSSITVFLIAEGRAYAEMPHVWIASVMPKSLEWPFILAFLLLVQRLPRVLGRKFLLKDTPSNWFLQQLGKRISKKMDAIRKLHGSSRRFQLQLFVRIQLVSQQRAQTFQLSCVTL